MQCEICYHDCDEDEIKVLSIFNKFYKVWEDFWSCPDCVHEYLKNPEYTARSK